MVYRYQKDFFDKSHLTAVRQNEKRAMARALADALGLSADKMNNSTISGSEMVLLLDKMVAYAAPDKLEEWRSLYPVLRKSTAPLNRYDMLCALYLALRHIGGDYGYIMPVLERSSAEMKATEGDVGSTWELFGDILLFDIKDWGEDHYGTAAQFFNISNTLGAQFVLEMIKPIK